MLPEDLYDEEIRRMDERVFSLTGIRPSFVMGGIEIQTKGGGIEHARGAYTGDQIIIQADHSRLSVTQIAEHELWHALADHAGSMNEAAWEKIVAR